MVLASHQIFRKKTNISPDIQIYPQSCDATSQLFYYFVSFPYFLRLPDLLWLWHVAQYGTPAPSPGSFKQQQYAGTQQEQRGWRWKRTGVFHLPRKDQPVLKFTSSLSDSVRQQVCKSAHWVGLVASLYTASPCVPQSPATAASVLQCYQWPHHHCDGTRSCSDLLCFMDSMEAWWSFSLTSKQSMPRLQQNFLLHYE